VNVTVLVGPQFANCNRNEVRTDAFPNTLKEERSYKIGSEVCRSQSEPPDIDLIVTCITGIVRQAADSTAILCQSSRPLSSIYVDFIRRKPPFATLVWHLLLEYDFFCLIACVALCFIGETRTGVSLVAHAHCVVLS